MISIKLDYFTLLSPDPVVIHGVGSIISPTLRQISKINYNMYNLHVDALLTDIKTYYEKIEKYEELYFSQMSIGQKDNILSVRQEYFNLSDDDKSKLSFFDILIHDDIYVKRVVEALNFFIEENVVFESDKKAFVVKKDKDENNSIIIGYIYRENYEDVVDIILQRIGMSRPDAFGDNVKIKNKSASRILNKIRGANNKKTSKKTDKKMEVSNIISSLAIHSKSLNMTNIWDLTVYQLYDQFARQQIEDSYEIGASHIAAWGDGDNKFDGTLWFSLINND